MTTTDLSLAVVRHTQTNDNVNGRRLPGTDIPLNAHGLQQALRIAEQLSSKTVTAIYSSPWRRARLVAELIGTYHPLAPLHTDDRLHELSKGPVLGVMTHKEIEERFPSPYLNSMHPSYDFSSVGGEKRLDVIERQLRVLRALYVECSPLGGCVVVVGHGTALRTLLEYLGHPEKVHKQGGYAELTLSGNSPETLK